MWGQLALWKSFITSTDVNLTWFKERFVPFHLAVTSGTQPYVNLAAWEEYFLGKIGDNVTRVCSLVVKRDNMQTKSLTTYASLDLKEWEQKFPGYKIKTFRKKPNLKKGDFNVHNLTNWRNTQRVYSKVNRGGLFNLQFNLANLIVTERKLIIFVHVLQITILVSTKNVKMWVYQWVTNRQNRAKVKCSQRLSTENYSSKHFAIRPISTSWKRIANVSFKTRSSVILGKAKLIPFASSLKSTEPNTRKWPRTS